MAQIDQSLQLKLTSAVLSATEAFNRLATEIKEGALAVQDMALELDHDGNKKAASITSLLIEKARKQSKKR